MKITIERFIAGKAIVPINLNDWYKKWRHLIPNTKIPFQIQRQLNLLPNHTYGGYGEYRGDIWDGTYLSKHKVYTHLGIDINIPYGSIVRSPFSCEVVDSFTDLDEHIGWGGRVILQRTVNGPKLVIAHLDPSLLPKKGSFLRENQCIGVVGTYPKNGNTFQHIHLQVIYHSCYDDFDGYGFPADLKDNPNPFEIEF
jgi:murein DD-endopeptidase MepM/ murein hydrolase activator NlpD